MNIVIYASFGFQAVLPEGYVHKLCAFHKATGKLDIPLRGDLHEVVEHNDVSSVHEGVASDLDVHEGVSSDSSDVGIAGQASSKTTEETLSSQKKEIFDFASSLYETLCGDPETFTSAVQEFIKNSKKLSTASAKVSALMTFGKYSGLSGVSQRHKSNRLAGLKRIGVEPTAVARRKYLPVGGRMCLTSGRPTKQFANHDTTKRKKEVSSSVLPKRRRAAPHSLSQCVGENI